MDEARKQLADKLKSANNVLVTVGHSPSVDQLSSLLGLTLFLNKYGKHAAAVFSGEVPSTLEFLQPDETIEKNTDSLRDFIISLDKSKADKLRYKVEDNVVRIFITPYRTSISQDDFEFSQGDFNVDVVVAIGVKQQEDLDEAIVAHGRILHDATVASINTDNGSNLGTINLHSSEASSLSEIVTELAEEIDDKLIDEQIATALLTGIVAETDRFSNDKTTSETMSASAALMAAGANQQLIASKLEEDKPVGDAPMPVDSTPKGNDGTLEIDHQEGETEATGDEAAPMELPSPDDSTPPEEPTLDLPSEADEPKTDNPNLTAGSRLITEPPSLGGTLTANTRREGLDPATDPLSIGMPASEAPQMFERKAKPLPAIPDMPAPTPEPAAPTPAPANDFTPPPASWTPAPPPPASDDKSDDKPADTSDTKQTLAQLEESVKDGSDDSSTEPDKDLNAARDEVSKALNEATATGTSSPEPIKALNAQPLGDSLHTETHSDPDEIKGIQGLSFDAPAADTGGSAPQVTDPTAPPPVPPPIPFQFGGPGNGQPPQPPK